MPRGKAAQDTAILAMALVGYELERQKIDAKISELRQALGKGGPGPAKVAATTEGAPVKRRTLSASARKRIAAAQKRRWAEHRRALAAQTS